MIRSFASIGGSWRIAVVVGAIVLAVSIVYMGGGDDPLTGPKPSDPAAAPQGARNAKSADTGFAVNGLSGPSTVEDGTLTVRSAGGIVPLKNDPIRPIYQVQGVGTIEGARPFRFVSLSDGRVLSVEKFVSLLKSQGYSAHVVPDGDLFRVESEGVVYQDRLEGSRPIEQGKIYR